MEICRTRYNILLVEIFLALHEIEKSIQGAMMGVLLIINLVPMYLTNLCIQMVRYPIHTLNVLPSILNVLIVSIQQYDAISTHSHTHM